MKYLFYIIFYAMISTKVSAQCRIYTDTFANGTMWLTLNSERGRKESYPNI